MKPVLCLIEDVFFKAKVESMLRTAGMDAIFGASVAELGSREGRAAIIVDGAHPEAFDACQRWPHRCYVFIRHTAKEEIERLRGTGCTHVHARSEFFADFERIFGH